MTLDEHWYLGVDSWHHSAGYMLQHWLYALSFTALVICHNTGNKHSCHSHHWLYLTPLVIFIHVIHSIGYISHHWLYVTPLLICILVNHSTGYMSHYWLYVTPLVICIYVIHRLFLWFVSVRREKGKSNGPLSSVYSQKIFSIDAFSLVVWKLLRFTMNTMVSGSCQGFCYGNCLVLWQVKSLYGIPK